jgi:hypothetical protein
MHPHARQDLRSTYNYQAAASDHRSRRSRAPSPYSRDSYGQAGSGAHRSSTSSSAAPARTTAGSMYSSTYDQAGSGAHRSSTSSRPAPGRTAAGSRYSSTYDQAGSGAHHSPTSTVQALHVLPLARCTLPPTTSKSLRVVLPAAAVLRTRLVRVTITYRRRLRCCAVDRVGTFPPSRLS